MITMREGDRRKLVNIDGSKQVIACISQSDCEDVPGLMASYALGAGVKSTKVWCGGQRRKGQDKLVR